MSDPQAILYKSKSFRYYDRRTTYLVGSLEKVKIALIALKDAITKAYKIFVNI